MNTTPAVTMLVIFITYAYLWKVALDTVGYGKYIRAVVMLALGSVLYSLIQQLAHAL